jgi:CheY-like chemotaxis protein
MHMSKVFGPLRSLAERRKRILLAEDDSAFRAFLADVLRDDGHDVVEVSDGQRLLEMIASAIADGDALDGIDLILSDIRMPRFNALEVAASLRSACIEVPILLMTAFGDDDTHQRAHMLGVLGVLDKPFEVDALRTAVCDVLFGHIVGVAVAENEFARLS